jgi:hypothetical protein
VRLIFRLAREGNGSSGPMGVKSISKHLNEAGIRTRDGGRWGVDTVPGTDSAAHRQRADPPYRFGAEPLA